jgi:hypothetical protein
MQQPKLKFDGTVFHSRPESAQTRRLVAAAALLAVAGFVTYRAASGQETQDTYKFGRDAQQGKKINPVPLNLSGKNPEVVYLGSYLVNGQGGCNSCHSCPSYTGIDPFAGGGSLLGVATAPAPANAAHYLAGGTPFPGRGTSFKGSTVVSANLTPDSTGLPAGLTFDDFKNAMQNGAVSAQPGHVLQVMPWPVFRNMYDNDLSAIYQYLSSIPQAKPGTCTVPGQTGN